MDWDLLTRRFLSHCSRWTARKRLSNSQLVSSRHHVWLASLPTLLKKNFRLDTSTVCRTMKKPSECFCVKQLIVVPPMDDFQWGSPRCRVLRRGGKLKSAVTFTEWKHCAQRIQNRKSIACQNLLPSIPTGEPSTRCESKRPTEESSAFLPKLWCTRVRRPWRTLTKFLLRRMVSQRTVAGFSWNLANVLVTQMGGTPSDTTGSWVMSTLLALPRDRQTKQWPHNVASLPIAHGRVSSWDGHTTRASWSPDGKECQSLGKTAFFLGVTKVLSLGYKMLFSGYKK